MAHVVPQIRAGAILLVPREGRSAVLDVILDGQASSRCRGRLNLKPVGPLGGGWRRRRRRKMESFCREDCAVQVAALVPPPPLEAAGFLAAAGPHRHPLKGFQELLQLVHHVAGDGDQRAREITARLVSLLRVLGVSVAKVPQGEPMEGRRRRRRGGRRGGRRRGRRGRPTRLQQRYSKVAVAHPVAAATLWAPAAKVVLILPRFVDGVLLAWV